VRLSAALIIALSLTLITGLLLGGCGGGGGGTFTLVGEVRDAGTLAAIYNALVQAGATTNTDLAGSFLLSGAEGNTATFSANDYQTEEVPIPGSSGTVDLGTVYLAPLYVPGTANITGTVSQGGVPVQGAEVSCGTRRALTRADGTYILFNVPAGVQTVMAVSPDHLTGGSKNLNVFIGQPNIADIQLTLQPPPPPVT
jgi:hypothetical protein